jgi:3-phytase
MRLHTLAHALVLALVLALLAATAGPPVKVLPVAQTDPVPHEGDAADDPAIWVNPRDPARSLILGTDKLGGLAVYDLGGRQTQYLPVGPVNNVDVRSGFLLAGKRAPLVAASHRTDKSIHLWTIDPRTGTLADTPGGPVKVSADEPYGLCLYRSAASADLFAFVNDKSGKIEQWRLADDGAGRVKAELVRTLQLPSQVEGMAADDPLGWLYVSEESRGLWRYPAEPGDQSAPVLVDTTDAKGHLKADAEGIAIAAAEAGRGGFLLVSSQGSSSFAVYDRSPPNTFRGAFTVEASASIDGCEHTDGLDATAAPLGAAFPRGLVVIQDGKRAGQNQNFKLVPLDAVLRAFNPPLSLDPPGP